MNKIVYIYPVVGCPDYRIVRFENFGMDTYEVQKDYGVGKYLLFLLFHFFTFHIFLKGELQQWHRISIHIESMDLAIFFLKKYLETVEPTHIIERNEPAISLN